MKKSFFSKAIVALMVLMLVAFSMVFVGCDDDSGYKGSAKNVVLLIGDGMGFEHLELTKAYYGLESLYMETMTSVHLEATTHSRNSDVTDSAASSTALSCGVKVDNKNIATLDGKNIENMDEFVAGQNMDMGIVLTERVVGGTAAGFASHSKDRSNTVNIFNGYMASSVDLFISQYNKDTLSATREEMILNKGYNRYNSLAEMAENAVAKSKIFATSPEFAGYGEEGETLADASTLALNHLKGMSDNGFFLMIESSHIDKYSHSGSVEDVVKEIRAFDEAVKAVIDWAKQDGNTIVIVTADHETGGLVYNPGDEFNKNLFKDGDNHTGANVGVFIYGLNKKDLAGVTVIDNIEINALMRQYIINFRK